MNLLSPQNSTKRSVLLLPPLYFTDTEMWHRKGEWLAWVTQLQSSRGRNWIPGLLATHSPKASSHCGVMAQAMCYSLWGSRRGYMSLEWSKISCYCSQHKLQKQVPNKTLTGGCKQKTKWESMDLKDWELLPNRTATSQMQRITEHLLIHNLLPLLMWKTD